MAYSIKTWKYLAIFFGLSAMVFGVMYLTRTNELQACLIQGNISVDLAKQAANIASEATARYAECVNYLSSVLN